MNRLFLVAGARPNFMKITPLIEALQRFGACFEPILVHTGQHYDELMSDIFFKDLELPKPEVWLGAGSGSQAEQVARIMVAFEKACLERKPNIIIVVGDVNSTLACSITAAKLRIAVAHVEAGLRSFDRTMPEEINRIVTDQFSEYLFAPSEDAVVNLKKEGIPERRIHLVGNVMIDTLLKYRDRALLLKVWKIFRLPAKGYGVVTLHRPSNVDDPVRLLDIMDALYEIQKELPLVFPVHMRTRKNMERFDISKFTSKASGLILTEPMGYLDFLSLLCSARVALTDSGGIQEETTALGIPCLTLRENTERPITVIRGTNELVKPVREAILEKTREVLNGGGKRGTVPELWDGRASERIVTILAKELGCAASNDHS